MSAQRLGKMVAGSMVGVTFILTIGCAQKKTAQTETGAAPAGGASKVESISVAKTVTYELGSPDFSMLAPEFVTEYRKNKKAFETKYKGKTIELSGEVLDAMPAPPDRAYVDLAGNVRCF